MTVRAWAPVQEPSAARAAGRVVALDVLKGLAICLMVMGHVYQGLTAAEVMPHGGLANDLAVWVYRFHMHSFFFAAGAVVALRPPRSFAGLLRNRAATLYYPHVLWGLVFYGVSILFARYANSPIQDPQNVPQHLLTIVSGQSGWFLPTLFLTTLLCWPLLARAPLLALAVVAILALAPIHSGVTVLDQSLRFAVFFVLGYLGIGVAMAAGGSGNALLRVALAAVLLYLPFTPPTLDLGGVGLRLQALVLGLLGVAGLWLLATALSGRGASGGLLAWLGRASLAIFLLHPLATAGPRAILLQVVPGAGALFYFLVISLCGIALPALAYVLARRWHLLWLFVWPTRRRAGDSSRAVLPLESAEPDS